MRWVVTVLHCIIPSMFYFYIAVYHMYRLHIVQISTVYHFEKEPFWDDNSGFTCCAWCPLVFGKTPSTAPHITSLWKVVYHTIAKIKDIDYIYAHCVLLFCVVLLCCCAEHSDVHTHNHTHTCIQPYIHISYSHTATPSIAMAGQSWAVRRPQRSVACASSRHTTNLSGCVWK